VLEFSDFAQKKKLSRKKAIGLDLV